MPEFMSDKTGPVVVELGSLVTLSIDGSIQKYRIDNGSLRGTTSETIISPNSQIGQLLLGKQVGEEVEIVVESVPKRYKILEII